MPRQRPRTNALSRYAREGSRAGSSFLELQVTFVIFGIALSGLCPLVVMLSRHLKQIEGRLQPQTPYSPISAA